jgi:hypothetical protein
LRVLYARVKATMTLRKFGVLGNSPGQRLPRLRLPAAVAGATVVLLTLLAGGSGAGISEYQGTLYFKGPASSIGSGNYQITVNAGPGQGVAPTAVAGVPGTGGPTGSFTYVYVETSSGSATASPSSTSVTASNAPITVSGVPLGADLYRQRTSAGAPNGQYILVASRSPTTGRPQASLGGSSSRPETAWR